jgi:hypothetical protein
MTTRSAPYLFQAGPLRRIPNAFASHDLRELAKTIAQAMKAGRNGESLSVAFRNQNCVLVVDPDGSYSVGIGTEALAAFDRLDDCGEFGRTKDRMITLADDDEVEIEVLDALPILTGDPTRQRARRRRKKP